jgi:DNA-directed RNA polymerase subunit M/transcription elongation factor TFIIS
MFKKTIENPDTFRANISVKLNKFFLPAGGNEKHGINLEKGIHNWALKEATNRKVVKKWDNPFFVQIYLDHLRSIYINLKNDHLIQQVVSDEIKSHTIAFMTHHEMRPDKWDELIRLKSIRDKSKFETHLEASTDTFTCRKCKSKKCSYYAQQVRSSDEPMTLFISCLECGARWKS